MNEELKWLAENMHEWPGHQVWLWSTYDNDGNHTISFVDPNNLNDPNNQWVDAIYRHQWRAARDELSGKPSWDTIPSWVNWIAQWSDGEWIGYEVEPECGNEDDPSDCYVDPRYNPRLWHPRIYGEVLGDWRDTLEQRPLNHIKPTEKVWQGPEDGLPPVGTECICEYYSSGLNKHTATIVAYADNRVWVDLESDDSLILYIRETNFKPLPTEEDKVVEKMLRIMEGGLTEVAARALYRCGLRFTEQTEGTK